MRYIIANTISEADRLCRIAKCKRLYRQRGALRHWLDCPDKVQICLVYDEDLCVGCGVVYNPMNIIGVYIRRKYRRKGIATSIIEHLMSLNKHGITAYANSNNRKFWHTINYPQLTIRGLY